MKADQLLNRIISMVRDQQAMEDEPGLNILRGLIEEYGDMRYWQGQDDEYLNNLRWAE